MDIYTYLYLADKVELLSFNLTIIGAIGSILSTPLTLHVFLEAYDGIYTKIIIAFMTLVFYLVWIVGVLIPSKDFMYQAGAVYLGREVIKNEQVQETFDKVKKVIDLNLDKQIKELTETK